jgi:hypothetical protein
MNEELFSLRTIAVVAFIFLAVPAAEPVDAIAGARVIVIASAGN